MARQTGIKRPLSALSGSSRSKSAASGFGSKAALDQVLQVSWRLSSTDCFQTENSLVSLFGNDRFCSFT